MKKSLIALAVLAASGAAMAQSSVTLYGSLDANYGERKTTETIGANTTVTKKTGLADGNTNGAAPGGSRWGFRGTEDLGGGMKANFQLEQRFQISDGTQVANGTFTGRSVVGLSGAFGEFLLGRDNSPMYQLSFNSDTEIGGAYSISDAGIFRRDNSINYISPSFGGFTVKAQAGQNRTKTTLNGVTTAETKDNGFGLSGVYDNGPLMAGLAYDKQKGLSGAAETTSWLVGGTYDFGVAKLFGNAKQTRVENGPNPNSKFNDFNLSVKAPIGAVSLLAGVGRNKFQQAGISASGTDYYVGAEYNFSKRTYAYARVGTKDKLSNGVILPSGNLVAGSTKNDGYSIGIKHNF